MLNISINKKLVYIIPIFISIVFQTFLYANLALGTFRITDELMVMVSAILLGLIALITTKINKYILYLFILFSLSVCISMIIGNHSLKQNVLGFIDIYKYSLYFLFLPYAYKYLNITKSHISSIVQFSLYAFLIYTILFYLFPTSFLNVNQDQVRMGIYRLGTFISDINDFALVLYMLFFAIYLNIVYIKYKLSWLYLIILMLFLTFSRSTIFILLFTYIFINIKSYRFFIKIVPIVILVVSFVVIFDKKQSDEPGTFTWVPINFLKIDNLNFGDIEYRTMVYYKSIGMFLDSPILGHGLGTFGTPTSLKYNNKLYLDYGFPQTEFIEGGFNVQDVYYPIIYVQTGLLGLLGFFIFWYKLLVSRFKHDQKFYLFGKIMFFGLLVLSLNSMTFMVGSFVFFYALLASVGLSKPININHERCFDIPPG